MIEIRNRYTGAVLHTVDAGSLIGANLRGANLSGADLSGADLGGANLSRAYLGGADLSRAYLGGADLSEAYLSGANLIGADLRGANLSGADLGGADLSGAYLSGANLSRAYLSGANLSGAYLSRADLGGADLSGADLSGAYLSRANLSGAYLSGAYLSGANLSGANLSRADLSGADGIDARRCTPLLILADQVGPIRAYKLVTRDYTGPTKPGLYYRVGDVLEDVEAETDPLISCARGVNLATLDWVIREWKETYRIMLVEFDRSQLACIPTATDGKFRVTGCRVLKEIDLVVLGLVEADQ